MNNPQEDRIKTQFGKRLRSLRETRGLSQEHFADLANLDRSYIGSVERGERNISLINILKITSALKISINKFFEGIDDALV